MLLAMLAGGCAVTAPVITGVPADRQEYVEQELAVLADAMERTPPTSQRETYARLQAFLAARPQIFGSAMAFAPGMAPGTSARLASPYVWRSGRSILRKNIARSGDYTRTAVAWYSAPAARGTQCWSEPYHDVLGAGARVKMVTYSIPVYTAGRNPQLLGVVTADVLFANR